MPDYPYELTCLVPICNEEGTIDIVLEKIHAAIAGLGLQNVQIIFVDDGSTDNSAQILAALRSPYTLQVITHRRNLGVTAVLRSGFAAAAGQYVLFLQGDMESDPEDDIPVLYRKIVEGYDVVAGYRQGRKDGKLFSSRIYNLVCRKLFHVDLHDMNWIKAYRLEVIKELELRSDWHRFVIIIAADKGYRITEVPLNWHHRIAGKSKFGLMRIPISFFDLLALRFLLLFQKKPMLFYGTVAFTLISSGLVIGAALVLRWILYASQIRPFLQLTFFLLMSGTFILMIGFLSEQIASLQDKVEALTRSRQD